MVEEVKVDAKLEEEKAMLTDLWADCKLQVYGVLPSAVPTEKSLISTPEVPDNLNQLSTEE